MFKQGIMSQDLGDKNLDQSREKKFAKEHFLTELA